MKLLFATDTQYLAKNPPCRLDNFPQAIQLKLLELADIARAESVTAVIHGGDFFDGPKISNKHLGIIGEVLKRFPCPIYVVPGNHDLFGYDVKTLDQTSLGVLAKHGIVKILTRDAGPQLVRGNDGVIVSIEGQEYHKDIDKRDPMRDYYCTGDPIAHKNILVPHGMLVPKPFFDVYTLIDDLPYTGADLILCGHYHPGYGIVRTKHGTSVVNPGATARDEGSQSNYDRDVQYAMIETDGSSLSVMCRTYSTAKPGKLVIDRQSILNKQEKKEHLQLFKDTVEDIARYEADSVQDILQALANSSGITEEIIEQSIERLSQAESAEDSIDSVAGFEEKSGSIYLTGVRLQNFQSHRDSYISLVHGLNVVTGASDQGKSAVIRAIKWVLYNEPKGTEFIRHGTKRSTVTLEFSDGTKLTRSRTTTNAGEYTIEYADGTKREFKGFTHNVPVEVYNAHQMPKTKLTKDVELSLNMAYQLDGPFLISESAGTRAVAIGRLTGVHLVDAAIREVGKDISNAQRDIKSKEKQLEEKQLSLEGFSDIQELQDKVNQAELLLINYELEEKALNELTSIHNQMDTLAQEILRVGGVYSKTYVDTDKLERLTDKAQLELRQLEWLEDIQEQLLFNAADLVKAEVNLENLEVGTEIFQMLEEEVPAQLEELQAYKDLAKVCQDIVFVETELETYASASKTLEYLEEAWQETESFEELVGMAFDWQELEREFTELFHLDMKCQEDYQNCLKAYEDMLLEAGVCPTCNSPITQEVIERLRKDGDLGGLCEGTKDSGEAGR